MIPPGNAAVFWPLGVKLLCSIRLNLPLSAIAASYTWISSVCANAAAGAAIRATITTIAHTSIFWISFAANPIATYPHHRRTPVFTLNNVCIMSEQDNRCPSPRQTHSCEWNKAGYHSQIARMGFMSKIHAVSLSVGARRCPLCGSKDVLRSHRRGVLEWAILLALLLRPVRCRPWSARHLGCLFCARRVKETEIVAAE